MSGDIAMNLMAEKINHCLAADPTEPSLWVVDENISAAAMASVSAAANLTVLTNRCDSAQALEQRGFKLQLSDFDFSSFEPQSFAHIFYRVSKEKPIVHHVINQAAQYLRPQGYLHISGYKNEGAKTYSDKAVKYLGSLASKLLGGKTAMISDIVCDDVDDSRRLDDKNYSVLQQPVAAGDIRFTSKPGVFGWNKIDRGSEFLIAHLPEVLATITTEIKRVADLGCGYGYLSVMASQQLNQATFYAVDNNVAAVTCCQQNFIQHKIAGEVSLDSCGSQLSPGFDFLLCNPPFHQGFDVESGLTDKFVQSVSRLLNKGGHGFFVVNAFIPLERKAKGLFESVTMVANNQSFKLLLFKK
ncbi:methyltransferase [Dasania sp. GY-MA-18]|uniref:Methyltransferase n=1 Tax=Dasania phycosphaerae TaxID=2950436 RepID=A0A9J6RH80_9GAMM|nr:MULTISPECIES: methyltransferase [Dasania]MCR8921594.1 methyltransferase [Dasania sp. GY-MA-18]MCZ0864022.1 methyltransferase [Dasania phycosphaerae]MCZ0867750.1 methyltransferase [Dasania phycosphaerae]